MRQPALMLVCVFGAMAMGGCGIAWDKAVLYGDTFTAAGDGFTSRSPQWACEGEPVTLDFAPDPNVTDYAVFEWPDGSRHYVDKSEREGHLYRVVRRFEAGDQPRSYVVRATAYMIRQDDDWYFDRDTQKWVFHLTQIDKYDQDVGAAKLEIICYRPEVRMTIPARGREIKDLTLTLTKDDGVRTVRRLGADGDNARLRAIGPDRKGNYDVRYEPTWQEVNRVGKTPVEVVVSYTDGTQELNRTQIDTP